MRSLLPLVRRLARRLKRLVPNLDSTTLVGDGCVGLIRAVDSFDPHARSAARRVCAAARRRCDAQRHPPNGSGLGASAPHRSRRRERALCAGRPRGDIPTAAEMERPPPRLLARVSGGTTAGSRSRSTLRCRTANRWHAIGVTIPARIVERRCAARQLAALIEGLPPRQREFVLLHYFKGTSLRAVGRQPRDLAATRLAAASQRDCEAEARTFCCAVLSSKSLGASLPLQVGASRSEAIVPPLPRPSSRLRCCRTIIRDGLRMPSRSHNERASSSLS